MLVGCRECGSRISTSAIRCPHCGSTDPTTSSGGGSGPVIKAIYTTIALIMFPAVGCAIFFCIGGWFFERTGIVASTFTGGVLGLLFALWVSGCNILDKFFLFVIGLAVFTAMSLILTALALFVLCLITEGNPSDDLMTRTALITFGTSEFIALVILGYLLAKGHLDEC